MRNLYNLKLKIFLLQSVLVALPFLLSIKGFAQTPPVLIFDTIISSGLTNPVDIVNAGDGTNRLFVVERGGSVKIVRADTIQTGNFLDIPDSVSAGGERGLLSIAFHPLYSVNRYFFVYYTNTSGDIRITRFQTDAGNPEVADEATGVVIMTIPHPTFANHNGGKLNFGPGGHLYFATGDGGSGGDPPNNAQNGLSLLGKMIRINVNNFTTPPYYTIPLDNPYVGSPTIREEIFALGLRNPWRWSFDRLNNDVWIADVGQNAWEEVDILPYAGSAGINYGWRCYEGTVPHNTTGCSPPAAYVSPIFVYPHNFATGGFSITGGYVYRGAEFPAMYGYYICADYVSGNVWSIKQNGLGAWIATIQAGLPGSITGFGETQNGDLYTVSLTGRLFKVMTSTIVPVTLLEFTAKAKSGYNELRWRTTNEQNINTYEIEYSFDGTNFENAGSVHALNSTVENNYNFEHTIAAYGKLFYKLKITDRDGRVTYSAILVLDKKATGALRIYPMPITGNQCTIISGQPIEEIIVYTMEGSKLFTKKMNNVSGTVNIPLPHLQNGMYIMQFKIRDELINEKIMIQH